MTTMKRTTAQDGRWISLPLAAIASTTETSLNFEIPQGAVIYPWEMFLVVDTVDAGETLDVGILSTESGGDADGFIDGYILDNAGYFCVMNMYTATDASGTNYLSLQNIGDFFFGGIDGANASGQPGLWALKAHRGDGTAKTISVTHSTSDSFIGRLVFKMHRFPL